MGVQETGTFSLSEFIEEASRQDKAASSKTSPVEKSAEHSLVTVTVRAKTRRTNQPVVSIVGYQRKSKGFVNTLLLRLIVVPAAGA